MTRAPATLLAARSLLLTHLDAAPGPDDLDPAEVGIVGNTAHRGGYHCGSDRVDSDDYSVDESPRDRRGLTLDAAALDVGEFAVTVNGRTYDLPHFSAWCVGQCKAGAPDTRDIREIIWSPDGRTVRRYDALGIRSTGDSSHRTHTHFSFFRDAIKAGRDQMPLFRRYLTTIGLLEDDMTPADLLNAKIKNPVTGELASVATFLVSINSEAYRARLTAEQALAAVKGIDTDEAAVARELLKVLTPQAIAAALPADMAQQVADELARRLTAGDEQQG